MRSILTLLLLASAAAACDQGELTFKTAPVFTVQIMNEYGPVVGMRVTVTHFRVQDYVNATTPAPKSSLERTTEAIESIVNNTPRKPHVPVSAAAFTDLIAASTTDKTGTARFALKTQGTFNLSVDSKAADIGDMSVEISNDAEPAALKFDWPGSMYKLSALQGTFARGWLGSSSRVPLASATLSLAEMISMKPVASTITAGDGSFQFSHIPEGMYFLRVTAKNAGVNDPDGYIPVVLKSTAAQRYLNLVVTQSSCGLLYDLNP